MARGRVCLVLSVALLGACGAGSENRQAAQAQGFQPGQPGQPQYAPPPVAPVASTPLSTQPAALNQSSGGVQPIGNVWSDPNTLQNIIAGALAGSAASLSGLTGGELPPIEQGIKQQAQAQARGMRPEGQLMSAKLQQDAHAQGTFLMQPGKCYTVIGFGGLGVFKYQINVITAPPSPPSVLAQSGADGVVPAVGANEQCLRNPYPLPMQVKVDMHVLAGQGLVGAQVYKK